MAPHLWRFWYQWMILSPGLGYRLHRSGRFIPRVLVGGSSVKEVWDDETVHAFSDTFTEARPRARRRADVPGLQPQGGRGRSCAAATSSKRAHGAHPAALRRRRLRPQGDLLDGYEGHADDMTVERVPGCGHFIADERPDLVAERAVEFLAQRPPRPTATRPRAHGFEVRMSRWTGTAMVACNVGPLCECRRPGNGIDLEGHRGPGRPGRRDPLGDLLPLAVALRGDRERTARSSPPPTPPAAPRPGARSIPKAIGCPPPAIRARRPTRATRSGGSPARRPVSVPPPGLRGISSRRRTPPGPRRHGSKSRLGLDATHMNGISCPSPSLCVAVGQNGRIVTTGDPFGGAAGLDDHETERALRPARCLLPFPSLCVAVGLEGNILSSTDPTGGAGTWDVARQPAAKRR